VRRLDRRIGELNGLRAFAILAVLVAKLLFNPAVPGRLDAAVPGIVRFVGEHCWLGVDLFFVLSGYLITRILVESRGTRTYFRDFWWRRALRILPVYLAVLVVFAFAYGIHGYERWFLMCLTFCMNFAGVGGVPHPDGGGPFWSLAVEEQFYLIWPFVVLFAPRRVLVGLATALVVVEPVARYFTVAHLGPDAFDLTWCRSDGLALGALVALWATTPAAQRLRPATVVAAFACISVVAFAIAGVRVDPLGNALRIEEVVPLFAAAAVAAIAWSDAPALGFLRSRALRVTADLSFCLYLIHVAILDAVDAIAAHVPAFATTLDTPRFALVRFCIVVPIAYGVAFLSRRFLEKPALRLRHRFTPATTAAELAREPAL
jgi:peptidoglycan/LPS O-acetylase OafA/YrhL